MINAEMTGVTADQNLSREFTRKDANQEALPLIHADKRGL
jgi:hypothetical protein